ncbi:MAG: short-chain dehydrogenase/reductase [Chitinophagaceae bacterium]|nr:short-chain dehydrogenase/reductase [Chitinophagaceae bacterium]
MEKPKIWLVTGASKGIGLALVKLLLTKGQKVAATSRNASDIADKITDHQENLLTLTVNITNSEEVAASVAKVIAHFGRLNVIVNNAGYSIYGSVEALSDQEFRQAIDVNLFGTVNVIRAALPYLRQQRSGHIINISSVAGYKGFGNSPSYAAAKFAVRGLSESLAEEVKEFNVKVTMVAPGFFRTSFLDKGDQLVGKNRIAEYHVDRLVNVLKKMNGHQKGDPEKLAAAIIQITEETNPPAHLLMGPDAYEIVSEKFKADMNEIEQWKALTISTDLDESDDAHQFEI